MEITKQIIISVDTSSRCINTSEECIMLLVTPNKLDKFNHYHLPIFKEEAEKLRDYLNKYLTK